MKGVPREQQATRQGSRPARLDKFEVTALIRPVDFISDNRKPAGLQMNADLMHSPGLGESTDQGKSLTIRSRSLKAMYDFKTRRGETTRRMDSLFQPDPRFNVEPFAADRSVQLPGVQSWPSPDEGEVGFSDVVRLHLAAKRTGTFAGFSDQSQPARFPVESSDDRDLAAIDPFVGE